MCDHRIGEAAAISAIPPAKYHSDRPPQYSMIAIIARNTSAEPRSFVISIRPTITPA